MFQSFVQVHIVWSILIVAGLTALYTVLGGLKAVVITESIQAVLLLVGALAVTLFGLAALGRADIHSLEAFRAAAKPGQLWSSSASMPPKPISTGSDSCLVLRS